MTVFQLQNFIGTRALQFLDSIPIAVAAPRLLQKLDRGNFLKAPWGVALAPSESSAIAC